jgi:DNA-binding NarL/FixJ family response regulator
MYKAVEAHKPDLLSLDLWLNNLDGLETIGTLKSRFPSLRILVLSQFDEMLYAERVLRAGASGYVTKEQGVKEVLTAIRTVLAGERYVSSKIAEGLHVSFKTVETHRENIKRKLGLSDAVELVRYAANWGHGFKLSRNPSDLTPAGRPCH